MRLSCRHLFSCWLAALCALCAHAVIPENNLEMTLDKLNLDLQQMQANADNELKYLQNSRKEYWHHIGVLKLSKLF